MGTPVGSVWEVTLKSTVAGQKCLNVLHYVVETESSETSIVAESLQLAEAIGAGGAVGPAFEDCLAQNETFDEIVAQCVKDTLGTRYARQVLDVENPGGFAADCTTPNVSAVITKRTSFSGRWAVGSFHMPGVPATAYVGGMITDATYLGALGVLAAELVQNQTTTSGGEYTPVIYHPDGAHGGFTLLLATEVQEVLRVMRRRTVGLGI